MHSSTCLIFLLLVKLTQNKCHVTNIKSNIDSDSDCVTVTDFYSTPPPLISSSNREVSGGLDSTVVTPQYRRGGCPIPPNVPECSDSHELETLMPPGSQESGLPLTVAPEEQSLMAGANLEEGEDAPTPDTKVKTCKGEVLFQMKLGIF